MSCTRRMRNMQSAPCAGHGSRGRPRQKTEVWKELFSALRRATSSIHLSCGKPVLDLHDRRKVLSMGTTHAVPSADHGHTMECAMLPCGSTFMKFDAVFCCEMGSRHRLQIWERGAYERAAIPHMHVSRTRVSGGSTCTCMCHEHAYAHAAAQMHTFTYAHMHIYTYAHAMHMHIDTHAHAQLSRAGKMSGR